MEITTSLQLIVISSLNAIVMISTSRDWCNFGECSRKTRPCQDFRPMKHLNYGQGENASLSAIGPEKQEQEISHKRSGNSAVRPLISIFKCLHP